MMVETMAALRVSLAPHRVALALTAGRVREQLLFGGTGSPLRHERMAVPARPPGWVRIAPTLAGICGSDRKLLQIGGMGRVLTAFYGLPRAGIVPGHEIVGTVLEADDDAGLAVGQRVVAEPVLTCRDKGLATCRRCAEGDEQRCARLADAGGCAPGPGFGFHARYGGGWAEQLVAPAGRVHPVPDGLDDRTAVLTEPMAVAVHAVRRAGGPRAARAVVIGPGAIGLAVVHALRHLRPEHEVTVVGLDTSTDAVARRAGAHRVVHGARRRLVESLGEAFDDPVRRGPVAGAVLEDGADVVFDTVGSEQAVDDAMRVLRPGGRLVLLATSARQHVDWSLVWHRELEVVGAVYYGHGADEPGQHPRHAFTTALEVLDARRPAGLVTHAFRLHEAGEALRTAVAGPAAGAVKVAFAPSG